jgi:hypothetical protein
VNATDTRRWCDQHRRYECTSWRRYTTGYCHGLPLKGSAMCHAHTSRMPTDDPRARARQLVGVAERDGVIVRPDTCELCAQVTPYTAAHHEDYSRPLDVLWLCGACHQRAHGTHGGLRPYVAWLRAQLDGAERLVERFYREAAA